MANSVGSVQIDLEARMAKFESDLGRAARLLEKSIADGAARAERAMQQHTRRMAAELDKIGDAAKRVGTAVVAYFSINALSGFARGLGEVADSYANIQAKVSLASAGQGDLAKNIQSVFDVAQNTFNSLEATTALVQRTSGALRNAGKDAATAFQMGIQLSEVFNKALVVSGASATEAASSAQQFSQALASGKFQGDEFRSVMENNSRFAQLLADSLGVTTSKLREMSTAGQLNIQSMLGVLNNTSKLNAEFAKMPVTIGRSLTQLSNAWTMFIGEADQASGASRRVAETIQSIGKNLPQIVSALVTLGEVAVAVFAVKVVNSVVAAGAAIAATAGRAVAAEAVWLSMNAAATATGTAMAAVTAAGRGLLALFGGIPGVIIVAASALIYFSSKATEVSEEVDRMTTRAQELERGSLSLRDALSLLATGAEAPKKSILELKEAELAHALAAQQQMQAQIGYTDTIDGASIAVEQLRAEFNQLREAQASLNVAALELKMSNLIRLFGAAFTAAMNWRSALSNLQIGNPADIKKEEEDLQKKIDKIGATEKQARKAQIDREMASEAARLGIKKESEQWDELEKKYQKSYGTILSLTDQLDRKTAAHKLSTQAAKDANTADEKSGTIQERMNDGLDKLANIAGKAAGAVGPLAAENERYLKVQRAISDLADAQDRDAKKLYATKGRDLTQAQRATELSNNETAARLAKAEALKKEAAAHEINIAAAKKELDILGPLRKDLRDRLSMAGLSDRDAFAEGQVRKLREEYEKLGAAAQEIERPLSEMEDTLRSQALATYDAEKAAETWRRTWESSVDSVATAIGDFATGQIRTWKDFTNSLVDTFKRAVASIISEWAKTQLLQMGNGGGFSWGGLVSAGASMLGGGKGQAGGQSGGFQYGQQSNPFSGNGMLLSYATGGNGGGGMSMPGGSFGGLNNPGQFGASMAWGGALMGASYGMTRGDGSLGTAGSTAAGAIAGYYAGTVAAGAILGAAGGYAAGGVAAAAGGASAGVAGAAAAVPVIGWIALIALVADYFSDGNIFGTKWRPSEHRAELSFSSEGATATSELDEWRKVSQWRQAWGRVFTGGALLPSDWGDKDRRTRDLTVDPEVLKAIEKIHKELTDTYEKAAHQLGIAVIPMLDATFETITTYTDKGKVKATKTIGTILGQTFEEPLDQFVKRMHAEAIIQTLDAIAKGASSAAQAYRANADELLDVAAMMMQAQVDITAGKPLLGVGESMEDIVAWVEKLRVGDEKLVDTYTRLAAASAAYFDIVQRAADALHALRVPNTPLGQLQESLLQIDKQLAENIKGLNDAAIAAGLTAAREEDLVKIRALAAAQIQQLATDFQAGLDQQIAALTAVNTPAGDFATTMRAIQRAMYDNIAVANTLARAQGLSGATTQQLARIHEIAARQAAAAIRQLESIAQQQVRSLYGTAYTLSDVDADIAELQGRADAAAQSVQGFGDAMGEVASAASDAINLLLGDLSPLNDQRKLQVALGGLAAGTVTQEQVLQIGRRLYASSSQYNQLFDQVMSMGSRAAVGPSGSQAAPVDPNAPKPLTTEEQERLERLYERRDLLRAQERLAEARELANTIASLAAAQGLSFEDVAAGLNFSLSDLADDLSLTNEDLIKYLEGIDVNADVIPDSITSNTDRILETLERLFGTNRDSTDRAPIDDNGPPTTPADDDKSDKDTLEPVTREIALGRRISEMNTAKQVDATERVVEAVNRLGADFRSGDADAPRSTRYMTRVLER